VAFVDTLFGPMLLYPQKPVKSGYKCGGMNVLRCTVIDSRGGVSFLTHGDALPALVASCTANPDSIQDFFAGVDPLYSNLSDYVSAGLAVFDELNTRGHYQDIHRRLTTLPRHKQPVFRVVDELTREASLRPVKAGAVIFNLKARRIVQMVNSYREIHRSGRGRVFDGSRLTEAVFQYKLPEDWALVP